MKWGRLVFHFFTMRAHPNCYYLLRVIALKLIAILLLTPLAAAATDIREEQLKAAYLFNFAKYTQWDEKEFSSKDEAILICVFKNAEIVQQLQRVEHKTIAGHPVSVREVLEPQSTQGCALVYIDTSTPSSALLVNTLLEQGILVITERKDGGVIEFVRVGDRLGFVVDLTRARKAGLKLSSDLLKLAVSVIGESIE